jgi:hypothetical protein
MSEPSLYGGAGNEKVTATELKQVENRLNVSIQELQFKLGS